MRVWPALSTPGELVRLPLACPPQLIELSGYTGGARLVALWWSPCGGGLMISDGALTETGRWRGWLCFCQHPLVRLFVEPYRLGDSEDEGEHRLLVDRYLAISARSRSGSRATSNSCWPLSRRSLAR
jgi:hypothetical protein